MPVAALRVAMLTRSLTWRGTGIAAAIHGLAGPMQAREGLEVTMHEVEPGYRAAPFGPEAWAYSRGFSAELSRANPELVHIHGIWNYAAFAGARWALRNHVPYVVSAHGMLNPGALAQQRWKKEAVAALFGRRHLERASCLHAVNDAELRSFRDYGLANPVCVLPNGVEIPAQRPEPPEWRNALGVGKRVLLYLGRIHPTKGLAVLLRAWARADGAANWTLVIAGWSEGRHDAELAALVRELGIGERVAFIGPQFDADKTATLAASDALILPSLTEGLPTVVLEAWSFGLPVLMTRACNLPDGFTAGAAVELPLEDADGMAAAIDTFCGLPDQARRIMGQRGLELVEARYRWDVIAREMAGVYRWLAGAGARPACVSEE